jgi:hypothetical protein
VLLELAYDPATNPLNNHELHIAALTLSLGTNRDLSISDCSVGERGRNSAPVKGNRSTDTGGIGIHVDHRAADFLVGSEYVPAKLVVHLRNCYCNRLQLYNPQEGGAIGPFAWREQSCWGHIARAVALGCRRWPVHRFRARVVLDPRGKGICRRKSTLSWGCVQSTPTLRNSDSYRCGYTRDIELFRYVETGIGVKFTAYSLPIAINPYYCNHPVGGNIFFPASLPNS